jgi:hypothetical protein
MSRRQQSHPGSPGAEFDHDQLHDDLQLPGGELSNDLCGAAYRTDQFLSRDRYAAPGQHHHCRPIVSEQLLVTAAFVPNQLCADIALAVMSHSIRKARPRARSGGGSRIFEKIALYEKCWAVDRFTRKRSTV